MWFPHQKDNQDMHTGFPWYNQSFFNAFNPDYSVDTYPISPGGIITDILPRETGENRKKNSKNREPDLSP